MRLITISHLKQIVQQVGIEAFLQQSLEAVEEAMGRWESFQKSPRHATHYADGVIELMPCSDEQYYSFKYVNGHPKNTNQGRLSIIALGMLADTDTGLPLLFSEMTLLTAIRTAATGALAARHLARPDSHRLGLIGTGAQSEFQLMSLQQQLPIEQIYYYDIDPSAMRKFARNMSGRGELIACSSVQQVVRDADLVITVTADRRHNPIIRPQMLRPGLHINAIGGDCPGKTELDPATLSRCKIVVEYLPQSRQEGEIQQFSSLPIHAELWEVVSGKAKGRENPEEITLFDSVGFAVEDYAILRLVYKLATELDIGDKPDLLPTPDDPKDLYTVLCPP